MWTLLRELEGHMSAPRELPRLARVSMSDQAYEVLKESIFSRRFAAGERLDLSMIEQQMGISRTPLREAITRLAFEGLIEIVPHSGTFVTRPSRQNIAEKFGVRLALEVYAIGVAAKRITDEQMEQLDDLVRQMRGLADIQDRSKIYGRYTELDRAFHRLIMEGAGNTQLMQLWEQVNVHVQMARIRYRRTDRDMDVSMAQHEAIARAMPERDPTVLRKLMSYHIERAKNALLRDLDEMKDL
jgi:DNA-binding GntR family transcriptional regulator